MVAHHRSTCTMQGYRDWDFLQNEADLGMVGLLKAPWFHHAWFCAYVHLDPSKKCQRLRSTPNISQPQLEFVSIHGTPSSMDPEQRKVIRRHVMLYRSRHNTAARHSPNGLLRSWTLNVFPMQMQPHMHRLLQYCTWLVLWMTSIFLTFGRYRNGLEEFLFDWNINGVQSHGRLLDFLGYDRRCIFTHDHRLCSIEFVGNWHRT